MKYFFTIVLLSCISTKTKCHITNKTKYYEVTTREYGEHEKENKFGMNNTRSKLTDKKFNLNESVDSEASRVYLDDVLFALKNINLTEEEKPCMDKIYLVVQSLQNFTLWAVWGKSISNAYTKESYLT